MVSRYEKNYKITMETPALCELLRRYNGNLKMCNVSEELVSWFSKHPDVEKFNKCSIVHLKSSGQIKKYHRWMRG